MFNGLPTTSAHVSHVSPVQRGSHSHWSGATQFPWSEMQGGSQTGVSHKGPDHSGGQRHRFKSMHVPWAHSGSQLAEMGV